MIKEDTNTYYQQKAGEVRKYILNNLDGDLSIKKLADYSLISHYHFHRIMTAYFNESLGSFIDRARLETAITLLRYSEINLLEIAVKIGYCDLSAFSKAFSKAFGISPNEYRQNKGLILNSNIDFISNTHRLDCSSIKPKFIHLPDKKVVFIQVIGKYGGEEVLKAWNEIGEFVAKNRLISWNPDIFSVYYDDPFECGVDNCKSDICITIKKEVATGGRIQTQTIQGGNFVLFRYKGSYDFLWEVYEYIYKNWVLLSDKKLRNFPIIEKYLNSYDKTPDAKLITDIFIPVE